MASTDAQPTVIPLPLPERSRREGKKLIALTND